MSRQSSPCVGADITGLQRLGKRIVWELDGELYLVFHLMIAGRFRWRTAGARSRARSGLAAFDFAGGTLLLTEAGSKRHASLYVVRGRRRASPPTTPAASMCLRRRRTSSRAQLRLENHTLKRALTDPRLFSGIGNAYSDEILLAAKLSPLQLTSRLEPMTRSNDCSRRPVPCSRTGGSALIE